ncbi:hypothetical protein GCM10023172_22950 [Hymenobacter ginsengisoli]|uniref:Uncharacterized protein n=1 Tax=Hymenobacter ginsengisoli TaxID=1051626 RepID=A0ABP8QFH7_9BACT|nr:MULTISPECIES: hypothetical protein [unclassified Hymenobacter]MBO2031941.1 hypothetical protein [Hymenobacter sp. BT559]
MYQKIYGATALYVEGDYVVIKTKDLPDHKSSYYTGANYEAYNGSNTAWQQKPTTLLSRTLPSAHPCTRPRRAARPPRR